MNTTLRVHSPQRLVACLQAAKAGQRIATGIWSEPFWTPERFKCWFSKCLADKINAKDPRFPMGRKASPDYELRLIRLRGYIGNRIRIEPDLVSGLCPRIKSALGNRVSQFRL